MAIEKTAPGLERILALDQEVEWLGGGFGGPDEQGRSWVAEGPVWWKAGGWWKEGGYLLFSDIGPSRRHRWSRDRGITIHREGTNNANGLTRDRQGRLVACEHGARRVTREELDGSITVVANRYHGLRFNRPNDVVVKSDGAIYFTDPGFSVQSELDFTGVFRVSPDLGTINLLARDFAAPNGLAFSTDEKILYVNDTRRRHIRAFDLLADGVIDITSDRVFCDLTGSKVGVPDGMKVDMEGNVFCTGPGGIWIISPTGQHLGTVLIGERSATNLAFGGDDWRTIFFTTYNELGCFQVKIPGVPVPRGQL